MGYNMINYDLDDLSACGSGGYWGQFDASYIADLHGCVREDESESLNPDDLDKQEELTEDQMERMTYQEVQKWKKRKIEREEYEDMMDNCRRCGGHGCGICLMLER
jgi:hypothetical protein